MESNTDDLMAGLTAFTTAAEIAVADQVETSSPTTTVLTTTTWVADGDEA